jgi:hypothetical protein
MAPKKKAVTKAVEQLLQPSFFFTISDIHIGHQPVHQNIKEFFDEDNGFFTKLLFYIDEYLKEGMNFAGLAICGDLFEHQIGLNSQHAKFAMDLIHALIEVVIKRHPTAKLIIIRGTYSHDYSQINIFEPFTHEFEDRFILVNNVTELDFNGIKTLCVPEEYMKNQDEFYAPYFNKKYDLILGHGFFKYNCFNKNEVEKAMPEMPIFDQDEIIKISRLTIFGHDHIRSSYKDQVYYNGSFSTNCHSDQDKKGFLLTLMDHEEHQVHFIENELTQTYRTVFLDKIVKGELNFDTAIKAIKVTKEKGIDFLKVKIQKDTIEENPAIVELLKNYFNNYGKRSIVIEAAGLVLKTGEMIEVGGDIETNENGEEEVTVAESRYEFLFGNELQLDEKVLEFIKLKHTDRFDEVDLDFIRESISAVK